MRIITAIALMIGTTATASAQLTYHPKTGHVKGFKTEAQCRAYCEAKYGKSKQYNACYYTNYRCGSKAK